MESRFQVLVLDSLSMELGFWIPIVSGILDSNHYWHSRFLVLYSRFQSAGLEIPQQKCAGFWIPKAKICQIPESLNTVL